MDTKKKVNKKKILLNLALVCAGVAALVLLCPEQTKTLLHLDTPRSMVESTTGVKTFSADDPVVEAALEAETETEKPVETEPPVVETEALVVETEVQTEALTEEETLPVLTDDSPMIALTFDDGPSDMTEGLVALLQQYNAKATFFLVGYEIDNFPGVVKTLANAGMEIGNHTNDHTVLTGISEDGILSEWAGVTQKVYDLTGQTPSLIRPPGGGVNDCVRSLADQPLVFWSIDTLDWEHRDQDVVARTILDSVYDGAILLMHDIHPTTIKAMDIVIPELAKRGYRMVTVSELAAARGVEMQAGQSYYEFPKES